MAAELSITERMEVVAVDGEHVGTVDRLDKDQSIKLAKTDPAAGGVHRWIPMSWVERVGDKVCLSKSKDEIDAQWDNNLRTGRG